MPEEFEQQKLKISGNHRRVISVRLRLLDESCSRLLELFHDVDSILTERRALPPEKADQATHLVAELRLQIAQMRTTLGLSRARVDAVREAETLVSAMSVDVEELYPHYLKGYGEVPRELDLYLQAQLDELLHILHELGNLVAG
jgi:hypothetical protein